MDAYSNLIVQMSENRVNDLRRETRQRAAIRLARLIARRGRAAAATPPVTPAHVDLPAPEQPAEERRIA